MSALIALLAVRRVDPDPARLHRLRDAALDAAVPTVEYPSTDPS